MGIPVKAIDYVISIHAPVKGATYSAICDFDPVKISIHAPVKGATRFRCPS